MRVPNLFTKASVLPQLAIHCSYHKCLTLYFTRVFTELQQELAVTFQYLDRGQVADPQSSILLFPHSEPDLDALPPFKGSHIIRDPRDLLVSGYFYHLRTDEEWCAKPNPNHIRLAPDESYQQHLHSLSQEDGLLFELSNVSGAVIDNMARWNYADERILELRFEDVVGNEREQFQRVFEWYGLRGSALQTAVNIAEQRSLSQLPKSSPDAKHARKGSRFGQWRDFFTPKVKDVFKGRFGEALIRLGYENSLDW